MESRSRPPAAPLLQFRSLCQPSIGRADMLVRGPDGPDLAAGRRLSRLYAQWLEWKRFAVDMTTGRPEHVVLPGPTNHLAAALDGDGHRRLRACRFFSSSTCFSLSARWQVVLGAPPVVDGGFTGHARIWARFRLAGGRWPRPTTRSQARRPGGAMVLHPVLPTGPLFASLIFGALFLWAVAPNWPPPALNDMGLAPSVLALLAFAIASGANHLAILANRRGAFAVLCGSPFWRGGPSRRGDHPRSGASATPLPIRRATPMRRRAWYFSPMVRCMRGWASFFALYGN